MSKHIERLRDEHKDFDLNVLDESFANDPLMAFQEWFDEACNSKELEPNAFSLCSVNSENNQPSSRIVYLKELRSKEFVFYTNYQSDKSVDINGNPRVSMLFFWPGLQRQVRIQGLVKKIPLEESDRYFNSRPRSSQLGAWASDQSRPLKSRETLEQKIKELEKRFPGHIDRPEFWGGYGVEPMKFEFWQGRPSRLHDRIIFEKEENIWISHRINP
tara:strand:- start:1179 stop:1826 length:648 start_codon:yes stop_codon:yes gene_type:complete